ncbi:MAG TPA: bifunctional precorrin-2 dehydrogenase/sirohydrochlorin ferrochelatase [Acidimicrobiia bacterium]|nr:bifunctional precorrin-2 dehydrogenase/sirohydrochlorin ferrochelatase [Acidimicrobiia bacterium]
MTDGPGPSSTSRPAGPGAPPPGYPVNLVVAGRRVVMVGAGRIAARKVEALLAAGAVVHVVAPRLGDEITAWRDAGRLTADERPFRDDDLDGAWLAFTAADDPAVNRSVYEAGEARRMFVNSADDPANCSLTLMSVVRRGDLQIAIGTGGRSPAMATHLRRRLTEELGPEWKALLDVLADVRDAIRAGGESSEAYDWEPAFSDEILELVRQNRLDEARAEVRRCLGLP